mmetsp:Transcript_13340/g.46568  ORF Transcript_13340/g.46568 Transcript_13340/m.46568 type:complete len:87 (-) Transcript_13340:761-1021(-)
MVWVIYMPAKSRVIHLRQQCVAGPGCTSSVTTEVTSDKEQDHRVHEEFAEEGMMDSDVGYPDLITVAPTCASFEDALKRVTSIFSL